MAHAKRKRADGKRRGCVGAAKIASPLRYDPKSAVDLTPEELAFGRAMDVYKTRWKVINPSCGMILDVLLDLGYVPPSRRFDDCVANFTQAMHDYKKTNRRPHPLWSECLQVLLSLGWKKPCEVSAEQK